MVGATTPPSAPPPNHGGNLAWAARVAGCTPSEILDFSASINPLGPPESAIAALQNQLIPALRAYPDPNYTELRTVLGAFHGIDPDWILPGNGAAELLTWCARALAALPKTCLPVPAFGDYRRSLAAFGGKVLPLPLDLSDPGSLPNFPSNTRDCGLILNNPHNPTGTLWQRSDLLPLLERFALVVLDEAFMDFLPDDESLIETIERFPNLVILRSLTKFFSLPGLRIGYAIASPARLRRWQSWRDPWSVNALATVASVAALRDRKFQTRTWEWLVADRRQLFEGLQAIPGLRPHRGAANFLLVECDRSVLTLQQRLLQEHCLLIRHCTSFPELGDRYFRTAVRTRTENQCLLQGLAATLSSAQPLES